MVSLSAYAKGLFAEILACIVLIASGYRLRNWRLRLFDGDIDIIAQKKTLTVLVEVRYRAHHVDTAILSLCPRKRKQLMALWRQFDSTHQRSSSLFVDIIAFSSRYPWIRWERATLGCISHSLKC